MKIIIIAALDSCGGIGLNGSIPWKLSEDMTRFKEKTTNKVVIMGRRTFESLGSKPLPNRKNIVISKTMTPGLHWNADQTNAYQVFPDLTTAITYLNQFLNYDADSIQVFKGLDEVYIIGGASLYEEGLGIADELQLTFIHKEFGCDTFFPVLKIIYTDFVETETSQHANDFFTYRFTKWERKGKQS